MRAHTNAFKQEIASFGKQISGRLYRYLNYDLITEDGDTLITEDSIKLLSEQINPSDKELIDEELIYSISLVKNGQLLQSLMKELDFEAQYDLKIGETVNAQFGVLVGNDFEYLDYGNYIVYSKEYIAENQTWQYVCYDKMLYSMVQYKPLNITYPCTIRQYLIALANRIGLTFANANDTFTNYNEQVLEELFEGQNTTYRDILDKLSEITASNILINDNDQLQLGYPSETNDTIDEENLKDVNVNFGEIFGPINKVAITETDGGYEYPAENSQSIETNGLWQVNINDNLFAFNGNSEQIAQNILNKLNGLYYSINDFSTTGVCYYDYLDLFNVSIGEDAYKCLLLNNEINITQGLEENIFTEKRENIKTEQNNYETSIINNKQVQFQINKQKGEISSRVEKNGVISAINQSAEEIQINADKISLAGKTIDMTSDNISIDSNYLDITKDGAMTLSDNGENTVIPRLIIQSNNYRTYFYSSLIKMFIKFSDQLQGITSKYTAQGINFYKYFEDDNTGYGSLSYQSLTIKDTQENKESKVQADKITTPKIIAGNLDSGTCVLNSSSEVTVPFNVEFDRAPNVLLTPYTNLGGSFTAEITNVTTTDFTAIITGTSSNQISYFWLAHRN